jgi:hypothetical protein
MATGDSNGVVREWSLDPLWRQEKTALIDPLWQEEKTALNSRKLRGHLGPINYIGYSTEPSKSSTLLIAADTIGTIRIFELTDSNWPRSEIDITGTQKNLILTDSVVSGFSFSA